MASEEELLDATKFSLEKSGFLAKIRAQINQEVMNMLGVSEMNESVKPQLPSEVKLLNDLIKEYLTWIGYSYTSFLMSTESSMPGEVSLTRNQMKEELGLDNGLAPDELPLLIPLVDYFMKRKT